ncbi:PREDICTED: LOW QUALITY PROTEIN: cytochrome c oxidase protein 20 homolog [Miniopterus natalensis]|uniref:LOW QUALITY PROTEIN: cytochrome c oxidase protein 20 homolog n=1 Tax=Miniopterus natalensis TaxID=291302 RepID=UPI0007A7248B|nr:PREDICTED: LOW QUALITY PROTEIN: cytochrome c oxidase protein 20 homolog [Miniopterus natalensis]
METQHLPSVKSFFLSKNYFIRLVPMAAFLEPSKPRNGKPSKLLGILDVKNISCVRDLVLYGSLGSVVAGLGHFLLSVELEDHVMLE